MKLLYDNQNPRYIYFCAPFKDALPAGPVRREGMEDAVRHSAHNLRRELGFFIWIGRNPLKSPDSDE
jgi:hypothetical protein